MTGRSNQRHVVVLAHALHDQERERGVAAVGHEVRPSRRGDETLARLQDHLFFQEELYWPSYRLHHFSGITLFIIKVMVHSQQEQQPDHWLIM